MKLTKEEAKYRFVKTGECSHDSDYFETFTPFGCKGVNITECSICQKRINKVYVS